MIRLNLSQEPAWHDLGGGVRVQARPLTSLRMALARDDALFAGLPEGASPEVVLAHLSVAVAKVVITGWEGVGDAEGNTIEPTPGAVEALMLQEPALLGAFHMAVLQPILLLAAEKKRSAPLRNGTSAGAPDTAPPAATPAKTARTRSAARKPRKAG